MYTLNKTIPQNTKIVHGHHHLKNQQQQRHFVFITINKDNNKTTGRRTVLKRHLEYVKLLYTENANF